MLRRMYTNRFSAPSMRPDQHESRHQGIRGISNERPGVRRQVRGFLYRAVTAALQIPHGSPLCQSSRSFGLLAMPTLGGPPPHATRASARQPSRDRERLACLDEARREAASEVWLGGRDSNPDTVVQSHVSYRWTTSQCQSRRFEAARTSDYSRSDTSGKRAIRKGRATTGGWPRRGAHGPERGPAKRAPQRDRGLPICPSPPRARHG